MPIRTFHLRLFLLTLGIFHAPLLLRSQTSCVQVQDESGNFIPAVLFFDYFKNESYTSDEKGTVCAPIGTYHASMLGYKKQTVKLHRETQTVTLFSDPILLGKVVVNELNYASPLIDEVATVSVIDIQNRNLNNTPNYAQMMNSVPGVFMHSGALNTNRLLIRGIGSRSQFNTEKVRAYLSNIPLTNGSGETTIEDLDLNMIGKMEIIKGPSSSQYGNSLAGTLLLHPRKTNEESKLLDLNYAQGSFGFRQTGVMLRKKAGKHLFLLGGQDLLSEGYRDNNKVKRGSLLASHQYRSEKLNWYTILYGLEQKAEIPSSLSSSAIAEDRRQAAFTWGSAKGYEDYQKLLIGTNVNYNFSNTSLLRSSVFGSQFTNYEPRPFNILSEQTTSIGTRNRLILEKPTGIFIIGNESFIDFHTFQTFENLYRDNNGNGSLQGGLLSDFNETRSYSNTFTQYERLFSPKWRSKLGLNLNKTFYQLEDNNGTDVKDLSGDYHYKWILSPSLSVSYQTSDTDHLYSSVNHGFSPPTLEETLTPDGLINTSIVPETGIQWEIGYKKFGGWGHINASLYSIWIKNLLVSRRTAEDQFIGLNAGSTIHQGLEIESSTYLLKGDEFSLIQHVNSSFGRFRFVDFVEEDKVFSKNRLPGVPQWNLHVELELKTKLGFLMLNYQGTGNMYIDDANTVMQEAFHILGSRIGRAIQIGTLNLELDLSGNNLLDKEYNSMVLVNAVGFGGNEPRYFYPALPRNILLNLRLKL